ncbi:Tc toxin subunit A [Xenorhabdus szentirmaii]|uniref:Tc toxin subunit A n=1 Tax=Xenorhabdus szentirmaii TaxID=290112 RepID=UPI000C0494C5|nr:MULTISPECIES: Tc toxin subunit A [Xenorhabdus]MBD2779108.1 insecticidal toxin [Xenorhabdus sp. 38]PHM44315.1 hypothetical protein Xszus_04145 [Xenorhabdus szentirmaii]
MNTTSTDEKTVTPLLASAFMQAQHAVQRLQSIEQSHSELSRWGYFSVFDIVKVGPSRFKRRHKHHFNGQAETLYQNALSYATQLIHSARERGLRDAETLRMARVASGQPELPNYADLFPEPWDNFCKPGALEALNSPAAYLVELYQFARQLELDATEGAMAFAQRRPDIPELLLDRDNTDQELPALQIVNEILTFIAADYIDHGQDTGKPVNQVLGETYYPYTLPFSLATLQTTLGLADKNTSLARVIQALHQELPDFCTEIQPGAANSVLLAATQLSQGQMELLTAETPFPATSLTQPELVAQYRSGSTTETSTDLDLSQHGYIVPQQQEAQGPASLTLAPLPASQEPYDEIHIKCQNKDGQSATVTLRGQSVLICQRAKRRLKPFSDNPPYPRQLQLSWHDEDNKDVDLSLGPWFGELTIQAQKWDDQQSFLTLKYHLVLSDKALPAEQLYPQAEDFFRKNYGLELSERDKLPEILFLIDRIKGQAEEIEQAIAWGDFSPVVSANIRFTNPIFSNKQSELRFPLPFQVGACYLNAGQPDAVGIDVQRPRSLTATTNPRFDRLQRLIRLQRWLEIPHHDLDGLLTCAMRAEGEENLTLEINFNTLRALGLFRHLNQRYKLSAPAFATLLHTLSPFAVSGNPTFLDQVFNQPKLFDEPFFVDNRTFDFSATRGGDARTIKQLCAGLKITAATFQLLAEQVNAAFELPSGKLTCSLPVISALYRLVTVPRLFNLTPEQGMMLINALSASGKFSPHILAGEPQLSLLTPDGSDTTEVDLLDIILLLEEMAAWLQQSKLKPEEFCLMLQSVMLPVVATDSSVTFFDNLLQGIPKTLLTENNFNAGDIPKLPEGENWFDTLSVLVTRDGLVKVYPLHWGQSDEDYLKSVLTPIAEQLVGDPDSVVIAVSALTQVITQAKTAQEDLVSASVTREYGTARDIVPWLLRWTGSSVPDFLGKIYAQRTLDGGYLRTPRDISDELLHVTYHLAMNNMLIKQLRLKAQIVSLRIIVPEWLGLGSIDGSPLSVHEIWALSRFRNWATGSLFSEDELIEYFAFANQPEQNVRNEENFNRDCAEKLADILEWDADEIELATRHFDPAPTRARNMEQIDWLRRVMALSRQTGLSVTPLMIAATLPPFPPYDQITHLGEAIIAATQYPSEE